MHVALSLDPGGLEHVILHLLRQGQRLGQRVSVLCVERPGVLAAEAEQLGATLYCAHKAPGLSRKTTAEIQKILAAAQPDIVHTHQIGALFYAGPAARRAGIPHVVHTEHGKHYETSRRKRWLAWWAARNASAFYCVSQDISDAVRAHRIVPSSKLVVVENGIDVSKSAPPASVSAVRAALGIPPHALVVGTVGRLAAVKSQDVLLRGFSRLSGQPHLLLVGGGPLEAGLRALAHALNIAGRVHFAGYQSDPTPYLHAMDIFALTSSSEGMPLSILEAWAASLPVVGSRVGGLPALIEDQATGFLFDAGDDEALARVLGTLLSDRRLCR
ncbi:MAG TPA: glycosyltransferase, partial [Phycisphaerae bacterium]|nr:glycosyltransferase [Phycisphaerae bacterium]